MSEQLLLERLRALPEADEAPSQFHGEPAFWIDGREFVHLHRRRSEVEIRLTRRLIRDLDDARVARRTAHSDWVCVSLDEVELAVELARAALEANRCSPQAPGASPAAGAIAAPEKRGAPPRGSRRRPGA